MICLIVTLIIQSIRLNNLWTNKQTIKQTNKRTNKHNWKAFEWHK